MLIAKRLGAVLLAATFFVSYFFLAANANSNLDVQQGDASYSDVGMSDWYYSSVQYVAKSGLMIGTGPEEFSPQKDVSVEEGIVIFARLAAQQRGEQILAAEDWFSPHYNYLLAYSLLQETEYTAGNLMTREFFVTLLVRIRGHSTLSPINDIAFLPDYDTSTSLGSDILKLYNAGILTGTNEIGSFSNGKAITRAELACIMGRFLESNQRVSFTPQLPVGLESFVVPIPADEWQDAVISFNGFYIAIEKQTGKTSVYNLSGDLVGEYGQTVTLSYEGDLEIFRTEAFSGTPDAQITYYNQGVAIKSQPIYRGSEFCDGIALVQVDSSPNYRVIDVTGTVLCEFTLNKADDYFPPRMLLGGGYVSLGMKWEPRVETTLLNCRTGAVVTLPIERFYGFDESGLALVSTFEEDAHYYRYLDESLQFVGEKYPYRALHLFQEYAQNGYYVIAGDFIPQENRNPYGVTDRGFQEILPAEYDIKHLSAIGKALIRSPYEWDGLCSIDILSEEIVYIWKSEVTELNVFYNDAFVLYRKPVTGTFTLYDFDGNIVSPTCDELPILGSTQGDSALYQHQNLLVLIRRKR